MDGRQISFGARSDMNRQSSMVSGVWTTREGDWLHGAIVLGDQAGIVTLLPLNLRLGFEGTLQQDGIFGDEPSFLDLQNLDQRSLLGELVFPGRQLLGNDLEPPRVFRRQFKLPKKAERVYGKPKKSDCTTMYLDREGKVQSVVYRVPEPKTAKGKGGEGDVVAPAQRPDVTRKDPDMIGHFRNDALHRAPIDDDTLMALLDIAFAGRNVRVDGGTGNTVSSRGRIAPDAATLIDDTGNLAFDTDSLRVAGRPVLIEVLSCRRNMSNSGIVSRVAGAAIGADSFLPNMGTEDFLLCLSRQALEGA